MQGYKGPPRPVRFWARASPKTQQLLRKGLWGLVDHALISATNFITLVLVARVLSPHEFGFYTLAYTGLLFTNSLQAALVTQPHAVLGAVRTDSDFARYTTATALNQIAFASITALVVASIAAVAVASDWHDAAMLVALIPAVAAWQLQEFTRRVLYTSTAVAQAFINDLICYGGQILCIMLLWRTEQLTPVSAIVALAGTSFLGFVFGVWQIRDHLVWPLPGHELKKSVGANWAFGKWLLGGYLASWTSSQIYPILAAGMISVAATGALRAVQTILGPTHVILNSLEPLFGPKAARIHAQEGSAALRSFIGKLQLVLLIVIGAYCLTVSLFAQPLLRLLYGPEYRQYGWLLAVMAFIYAFTSLKVPLTIALEAMGHTQPIFRAYLASTCANLTLGVLAIYIFGLGGVGIGMILNTAVLQIAIWNFYLRFTGRSGLGIRFRRPGAPSQKESTQAST